MDLLHPIFLALWHQDFDVLSNPHVITVVYGIICLTLFLENGLLPAAFLPGDSLLLLTGALVSRGVMSYPTAIILLTIAAALGCWFGYIQGRWLGDTKTVKKWLAQLPETYHQRSHKLFAHHGLLALVVGRFLAFVRTLLPTIAGLSDLDHRRFQLFNWLSAFLWVSFLVTIGYAINQLPLVKAHQDQVMTILMILPVVLLCSGLLGAITLWWRKKTTS